jgi:DNA (cytosine-5)-methyltransferase 1
MKAYETTKIGHHRGNPRLWLQGRKASRAGFHPGKRFRVRKDETRSMLVLEIDADGERGVSRKIAGAGELPVIDINSAEDLAVLTGFTRVRVISQKLRIVILPCAVELAKKERLARLRAKIAAAAAISVGSISHGGGILDHALHSGMRAAGVKSRLAFANDIRPELLEHAPRVRIVVASIDQPRGRR